MLATSPTDETPTSCTTCPYPVKLLYNILLTCVIHTGSKLGLGLALWAEEPFGQTPEAVVKALATDWRPSTTAVSVGRRNFVDRLNWTDSRQLRLLNNEEYELLGLLTMSSIHWSQWSVERSCCYWLWKNIAGERIGHAGYAGGLNGVQRWDFLMLYSSW